MKKIKNLFKAPAKENKEIEELSFRTCLKCDQKFKPEHKHNRICPSCAKANSRISSQASGIGFGPRVV